MTNPNPSPIGIGFGFVLFGAGEGNRTHTTSLEGWDSSHRTTSADNRDIIALFSLSQAFYTRFLKIQVYFL